MFRRISEFFFPTKIYLVENNQIKEEEYILFEYSKECEGYTVFYDPMNYKVVEYNEAISKKTGIQIFGKAYVKTNKEFILEDIS
jgi:hypothetical protein